MSPAKHPKTVRRTQKAFDDVTMLELATGAVRVMLSEKEMERACDRLAKQLGADIVTFSQPRNTMQTPGIADRRYRHRGQAVWFEVKPEDGKLSQDQLTFLRREQECGMIAGAGGVEELQAILSAREHDRYHVAIATVNDVLRRGLRREKQPTRGRPRHSARRLAGAR